MSCVRICNSTRWLAGPTTVHCTPRLSVRRASVRDTQRVIALIDIFNDHAEAEYVGELFERDRFRAHLAPD